MIRTEKILPLYAKVKEILEDKLLTYCYFAGTIGSRFCYIIYSIFVFIKDDLYDYILLFK